MIKGVEVNSLKIFRSSGQGEWLKIKEMVYSDCSSDERMESLKFLTSEIEKFDNGCVSKFKAFSEIWKMMANEDLAHNGKYNDEVDLYFKDKVLKSLKDYSVSGGADIDIIANDVETMRSELVDRLEGVKDCELWQCAKECGLYPDDAKYTAIRPTIPNSNPMPNRVWGVNDII